MATRKATRQPQQQEVKELLNRIDWIDEQRRKSARKLAELEQRFTLQEKEIVKRDERIQELERNLSSTSAQLARFAEYDARLLTFRDEMVENIEQYDKRRIQSEKDSDRLRRVEHETLTHQISDIRKELPAITRIEHEMELRVAEETRLSNLIAVIGNEISPIRNQVSEWEQSLAFLEEKEKKNNQNVGENQTQLLEIGKKWDPINTRIEILANTLSKSESSRVDLIESQIEQREIIKKWAEQIQIGEHERNQQLEKWRYVLDEQNDTIARFSREWVKFADQYKEAKMALQAMIEWQKQIEQKQKESGEVLRVELNRMQSRWDGFLLEDEQKWKNFQVESEQRWAAAARTEKKVQEQIVELENKLVQIREDKDILWRIQTAQADAIKLIPRIWLEEIEKAKAQDPKRRRQPTMVPVREE